MSTTSIQPQMGYAAQASPVSASPQSFGERVTPIAPHTETSTDPSRIIKPLASPPDTAVEKNAGSDKPNVDMQRVTRKTDIDWTTNSLVYRVIDSRSGQVVSQSPDEALLRLRAYAKQALTQSESAEFVSHSVSREL